jgi:hypothetical protein
MTTARLQSARCRANVKYPQAAERGTEGAGEKE